MALTQVDEQRIFGLATLSVPANTVVGIGRPGDWITILCVSVGVWVYPDQSDRNVPNPAGKDSGFHLAADSFIEVRGPVVLRGNTNDAVIRLKFERARCGCIQGS